MPKEHRPVILSTLQGGTLPRKSNLSRDNKNTKPQNFSPSLMPDFSPSCPTLGAKRDCHGLTPVNNQTHDSCSLTPYPPSGWKNWKGSEKTQGLRLDSLIQYRNNTNTLLLIYIKWEKKKRKWYSVPHEFHPHWAASPGNRVPWSQTAYPG